jgi:HAD superfamily hydrolase (TIGR01490 family)
VTVRAAFFDMDHTLVRVNTGRVFARWRYDRGTSSLLDVAKVAWWSLQYAAGTVDAAAVSAYAATALTGVPEHAFADECRAMYEQRVRMHLTDFARRAVEARRREGLLPVILTGSSPYTAAPLADELGIEHVLSSRLQVVEGRFTGAMEAPLCFGAGKVVHASAWARDHAVDLSASAFYTDSVSDLPMLERVGEPRVINPDLRLRRVARRRGWPIESWR